MCHSQYADATKLPIMMPSSHSTHTQRTLGHYGWLNRRTIGWTSLLVVSALGLSACGPGYDDPTDAAEQFGTQLASHDVETLEESTMAEGSIEPEALIKSTEALADYPVSITLDTASVNEDDQASDEQPVTATAQYTVTWDLSGTTAETDGDADNQTPEDEETTTPEDDQWSYTTEATLVWDADAETWRPQLQADALVPGLAEGGQVEVSVDAAQRGDILDTRGEPLATERPVQRIGIDKAHVLDDLAAAGQSDPSDEAIEEALTDSSTELAEALDLDADPLIDRVLAAGERAWVEFIVLRDEPETEIPTEQIREIPGATSVADTMVLGPTATFARSLLGAYGEPNAEQIENSDGEFVAGVPTGLSGLQRTYNEQLAGTDGLEISVNNSDAETQETPESAPVEFSRTATDGSDITTTVDMRVQELAEESIHDADAPTGMVVIRPSDGHILAAADGPEELTWPLAMTASYAPGSTFKVVTALAMLRNGMTPDSTVSCPPNLNIDGLEISNFDEYPVAFEGEITLAEAIAQSCNTTFVGQYEDISPEQEQEAAAALGLVEDPVVGFDGAFLGTVPTDVEGTTHAAGLFGQGAVQASPLGMATVAASVSAGETVMPLLVADPAVEPTNNDNLPVEEPLTTEEAEHLQELMAGPVESGTVPILQEVPGPPVLAKTGTAESEADGEAIAHTWLMATQDDIAVALFVHDGVAGAQTNGPIVQDFLTELTDLNLAE